MNATAYEKPKSIIPANDSERLAKLYGYEILDTPFERTFDQIAELAAQIFDTPGAYVTFVDSDRVYFKADLSMADVNEVLRRDSLCSLAILEEQITVFSDTHQSEDLMQSPYVNCEGGIRFYAGAPLITPEGYRMGTVCVVDSVPREATQKQLNMLEKLASIAIDELESRMRAKKAMKTQVDLLNITMHELKNPLASIQLGVGLLREAENLSKDDDEVMEVVAGSLISLKSKINDLLALSKMEDANFNLVKEQVEYCLLLQQTQKSFGLQARQKGQTLRLECQAGLRVKIDQQRITDVLHNLVSNAIKFSYPGSGIVVKAQAEDGTLVTEIRDEGQGLTEDDLKKLFVKFARLSSRPTGKETSTGLGLSICKVLVNLHGGHIWAKSAGSGQGTSFYFSLPL